MLPEIIAFLVMLNPFALFLYLNPIMDNLKNKEFLKVLFEASAISFAILIVFLLFGNFILEKVFQINFESFRIFGGIIIFSFAYLFIVKGQKAMIHMKEDLEDLASEIALPFMVGAGTISLSVLMGFTLNPAKGTFALVLILIINFLIIVGLKYLKDDIKKKKLRIAFDKNMEVFLRVMGFMIGAIGINMIVSGIKAVFF